MNRNAFKVPLLNRDGKINTEMLPNYDENDKLRADYANYANYLVNTSNTKINVGSDGQRIYFGNGVPTEDKTTRGSDRKPIYLNQGVFTACKEIPVFRLSNPDHKDGPTYNLEATNPIITLCHNQTYKQELWQKIDGSAVTSDPIFSYVSGKAGNVDEVNPTEGISYPNNETNYFGWEGAIIVGGEGVQFKVNYSTQDFFTLQVHIGLGGQEADDDIIRINVTKLVKYIFNYSTARQIKSVIALPVAQNTSESIPPIAAYGDSNYAYIHANTTVPWRGVSIIIKYD